MTAWKTCASAKHYEQSYWWPISSLIAFLFFVISTSANATEYVSWLSVRYQDGAVKTFLQGPYPSRLRCDQLNQTTWDNVLTACKDSCKVEEKSCLRADEILEVYAKAIRKERTAFPYVVATPAGRIIISGVSTSVAVAECHRLARDMKSNAYSGARCMLP